MKVSIKIGKIILSASVPAHDAVAREVIARNGVVLEKPEIKEIQHVAAKSVDFTMDESAIEFECDAGELPAIYKEVAPMFKDLMQAIIELKKFSKTGNEQSQQRVQHGCNCKTHWDNGQPKHR